MSKKLKILLFILAFIEGGAVMVVELCSAKILAPFFGTSIYVWASVLGITLTALMSGYYLGGFISTRNQKISIILWLMLIAGCFVSIMPIISDLVLPITINLNILMGTILSLLCFLFFPLLLFGSISPLIINLLTTTAKKSGKITGNIYSISTLGGIITTFTVGFYTMPKFGISNTLYSYGVLIMIYTIFLFLKIKVFKPQILLLLFLGLISYNFQDRFDNEKIIYQSEGILGEIKVVDRKLPNYNDNTLKNYRELMVNNISQTIMDIDNPNKSYWDYVDILSYNINSYTNGHNVLLLGLGGGTLYKQLEKNSLVVDVVEIDARIEKIAKQYFNINNTVNVVVDDARHYINTTQKKYDIIIYDLYHSETPPIHLMTKESFREIKTKLNNNGVLVVNFYGFISGSKGKAARSIYKTLLKEDYHIKLIATPGAEQNRNLLFICSQEKLRPKNKTIHKIIENSTINLQNAVVLTDDKPILEHIYLEAALAWRKNYNEVNAKYFLRINK